MKIAVVKEIFPGERRVALIPDAISALTKDVKTVFTTEDIDNLLPHRYPFALVDKVCRRLSRDPKGRGRS